MMGVLFMGFFIPYLLGASTVMIIILIYNFIVEKKCNKVAGEVKNES